MKTKSILLLLTTLFVSVMLSAQVLPSQEEERMSDEKYKEWLIQTGYIHMLENPFIVNPYFSHPDFSNSDFINPKENGNQTADAGKYNSQEVDKNMPVGKPFMTKRFPRIKPGFRTSTSGRNGGGGY